jgi:hypothetical protein
MTRDEILKMSAGREMDALIAILLGWQVDELTAFSPTGSRNSRHKGDDNWLEYYSSDIAAAWQVVEKLRQQYRFELFEYTTPEDGRHYRARFYRPRATMFCSEVSFVAPAYYPAVAICRAALLAVMECE